MHHLEASLDRTPMQYVQHRYLRGNDREVAAMAAYALTPTELEMSRRRGEVCEVTGRFTEGRRGLVYECKVTGSRAPRTKALSDIKARAQDPDARRARPHVLKLARQYDERAKGSASGLDQRPLTCAEVNKHLADFGISRQLGARKMRLLSGGQRCRVVLAACMWARPHLVALDEPTNYLDNDTLAALTQALRAFKGGVITISHNHSFVRAVCGMSGAKAGERWTVAGGSVVREKMAAVLAAQQQRRRRQQQQQQQQLQEEVDGDGDGGGDGGGAGDEGAVVADAAAAPPPPAAP